MRLPLCIGLILAAGTILPSVSPQQQQVVQPSPPDMVTVDTLTALYLRLENAMWQVIRSGSDQADKLRRIHETHLTLFETDFREKGVTLNRLDADQSVLHNAIAFINQTAAAVRVTYLHDDARNRKRDESVAFARVGVNMSQTMEKIFNVTEVTDFYHYVARKGLLQSCELGSTTVQSAHQQIYDYYHDIATAELKAYAITQLSHMFLTVYEVRPSQVAAEQLRRTFLQRTSRAQERVRSLLATASREVWVCDPDDPKPMVHAAAVTRLLQGYVDNEVNLNEVNDCKKQCGDYQLSRNYKCFNGSHCAANQDAMPEAELRCNGAVVGCEFISSDMEICHSLDPTRRYNSIKYTCGKKLGAHADECVTLKTKATSWTRWLVHCSHCFCYCDEPGPHSDRYFSLHPVLSDIAKNKVVVGVAIRKINRVFYWQIIERTLIANAEVGPAASRAEEDFTPTRQIRLNDQHLIEGVDIHTLSYANRSISLDVLQVPPGYVCTGVRFASELGNLRLEVHATKFNFKSGQLSRSAADSQWVKNTIFEKMAIPLEGLRVPEQALSKSVPDLRPNHYVQFTPSDKWSDVAQSTVPYLDTQVVQPAATVPLAGIGLYYKGLPEFGGYVAPKLVTFDYTGFVTNM